MVKKFTIVVPTYTGEEHLDAMFDSLLAQKGSHDYAVVVVIDGPRESLRQVVERNQAKFKTRKISFTTHQFSKNQGRFFARFKGAELAKTDQLLFADDRNIMDENYLSELVKANEAVAIPNVIQTNSHSPISRLLYLLRKRVYGQWGGDFEPYYITAENFEKSSKGTTGLWVERQLFLDICQKIKAESGDVKNVNEDTRLLKDIIARGHKIYRSSAAKVYYQPRIGLKPELRHLYDRGPRFVDYYLRPGTRFFYPLVSLIVLLVAIPVLLILHPILVLPALLAVLLVDTLAGLVLMTSVNDFVLVVVFLPLIGLAMIAGIIKGLIKKVLP